MQKLLCFLFSAFDIRFFFVFPLILFSTVVQLTCVEFFVEMENRAGNGKEELIYFEIKTSQSALVTMFQVVTHQKGNFFCKAFHNI